MNVNVVGLPSFPGETVTIRYDGSWYAVHVPSLKGDLAHLTEQDIFFVESKISERKAELESLRLNLRSELVDSKINPIILALSGETAFDSSDVLKFYLEQFRDFLEKQ